jgi:hypothetical protein
MLRFAFACAVLAGCGSSTNPDAFATFQACYDEHTTKEAFTSPCAIEICCIDHQIGSTKMNIVCGDTTQSCESYVMQNLSGASSQDVTTACTNYLFDSGRGGTGPGGACGG